MSPCKLRLVLQAASAVLLSAGCSQSMQELIGDTANEGALDAPAARVAGNGAEGLPDVPPFDSGRLSPFGADYAYLFVITEAPPATSPVSIRVEARADLDASNESITLRLNQVNVGTVFGPTGAACGTPPDTATIVIPAATFNERLAAQGGDAEFQIIASPAVDAFECATPTYGTYVRVTVEYCGGPDCDGNGISDNCDIANGAPDANRNHILDACELGISTIVPAQGVIAGGAIVTISGKGFQPGTAVLFGDRAAADVKFFTSEVITAVTPPGTAIGPIAVTVQASVEGAALSATKPAGFTYVAAVVDSGLDSDKDGLSDAQELAGYEIWVDQFGLGLGLDRFGNVTRRFSYSDPMVVDTDGDGLTDFEEALIRCDASMRDTDGDSWSDYREWVNEWTSPTSVDSDGDARGPGENVTPNAALFDAQERVMAFDLNGRLVYGGTSPLYDDTDGDGASDFDEWGHPLRSAVVADIPRVKIDFVGSMNFQLDVTLEDGTNLTEGQEFSLSESQGSSMARSNETTWEETLEFTVSIAQELEVGGFPPGVKSTTKLGFETSIGFTEGGSTSWSSESSTETQEGWVQIQEASRSQSRAVSGGTISAGIKIRNAGNVAFTLENLVLSALVIDPRARDAFRPLTNFRPPVQGVTLAAFDETGVLVFQTAPGDVGSELLLDFMAEPRGLLLDIASFDLLDAEGRNYAFLNDVTNARTATVIIDYGPQHEIETYRVATEAERNPDGTPKGITVGRVLTDFLRVPYETRPRVGSQDPNLPDGVRVLTKVRGFEADLTSEADFFWVVYGTSPQYSDGTVDFEDLLLHASDRISLVFTTDIDDDRVYQREEFTYLTSDEDPDSDDDTLSDYVEIREGWDLVLPGQEIRRVYPSPTNKNLDQDLLDDADELAAGTHPKDPDTDGDGLIDGVDNCPLHPLNVAPAMSLTATTDVSGSEVSIDGAVFEALDDGTGRCDVDTIDYVEIDWGDGTPLTVIQGNDTPNLPVNASHNYATQNVDFIIVRAYDERGAVNTQSFEVEITFPVTGLVAFYPLNGNGDDRADNGPPVFNGAANSYCVPTASRFNAASGAFCFRQDQVIDGNPPAAVLLPTLPLPGPEGGVTISAWLIPHGQGEGILVGQDDFAALFADGAGKIGFTVRGGDGNYYTALDTSGVPVPQVGGNSEAACLMTAPAGSWSFFCGAARVENGVLKVRLYRGTLGQGQQVTLVGQIDVVGAQPQNPVPTNWQIVGATQGFGPVPSSISNPFAGRVDDVRFYQRHLIEVEVNALFNEPQFP